MEWVIEQSKLKPWLELEETYTELIEAIEHKDFERAANSLCLYVSIASGVPLEEVENLPWTDVVQGFTEAVKINSISVSIPLVSRGGGSKELMPWDYPRRSWFAWAHKFATIYGWSLEYIAELDVADATKLLQEMLIQDQLEKEWEWGLSDRAFPYNSNTKKNEYKPLSRPPWMYPEMKPKKKKIIQIPKSMMPVGNIVKRNGLADFKH